jgi:tetratricopeptide (TPR) repeat protein
MKIKMKELNFKIADTVRNALPEWFTPDLEFDFLYQVKAGLIAINEEREGNQTIGVNLWKSENPSMGEARCGELYFINKGTKTLPNIESFTKVLEINERMNLKTLGFTNEIGETPPECILQEPLEKHLSNLKEFSSIVLALTFPSGDPQNPTVISYVFYFFKGKVDSNRPPDDILTFKIKLDNLSEVHIVDKYLGGDAYTAKNAPPLDSRESWYPGMMTIEGRMESERYLREQYSKAGMPSEEIELLLGKLFQKGAEMQQRPSNQMKPHGWRWKTKDGQNRFTEILSMIVAGGGRLKGEDLKRAVTLADDLVALEDCLPDSFFVLSELGSIYSESAIMNYRDLSLSNELISKAKKAQELASKYIIEGRLVDPEQADEFQNRVHLKTYYTNFCLIGFARYVQSDCQESKDFLAAKPYYDKAIALDPNDSALKFIGEQMRKLIDTSQSTSETSQPKKSGGCFVVTAAYGNSESPEVVYLADFRDKVLGSTVNGKKFIEAYYILSPYVASIISESNTLKLLARIILIRPLVFFLRHFWKGLN